jgi:hypothetical protein
VIEQGAVLFFFRTTGRRRIVDKKVHFPDTFLVTGGEDREILKTETLKR